MTETSRLTRFTRTHAYRMRYDDAFVELELRFSPTSIPTSDATDVPASAGRWSGAVDVGCRWRPSTTRIRRSRCAREHKNLRRVRCA